MPRRKEQHLKDTDLAHRYDFDNRKHLHVMLFTDTKNELKVVSARMNMSVTKMFECLAQAIIDEDPYIIKMLNKYRIDMKDKRVSQISKTDADSLFRAMEEEEDDV